MSTTTYWHLHALLCEQLLKKFSAFIICPICSFYFHLLKQTLKLVIGALQLLLALMITIDLCQSIKHFLSNQSSASFSLLPSNDFLSWSSHCCSVVNLINDLLSYLRCYLRLLIRLATCHVVDLLRWHFWAMVIKSNFSGLVCFMLFYWEKSVCELRTFLSWVLFITTSLFST